MSRRLRKKHPAASLASSPGDFPTRPVQPFPGDHPIRTRPNAKVVSCIHQTPMNLLDLLSVRSNRSQIHEPRVFSGAPSSVLHTSRAISSLCFSCFRSNRAPSFGLRFAVCLDIRSRLGPGPGRGSISGLSLSVLKSRLCSISNPVLRLIHRFHPSPITLISSGPKPYLPQLPKHHPLLNIHLPGRASPPPRLRRRPSWQRFRSQRVALSLSLALSRLHPLPPLPSPRLVLPRMRAIAAPPLRRGRKRRLSPVAGAAWPVNRRRIGRRAGLAEARPCALARRRGAGAHGGGGIGELLRAEQRALELAVVC